LQAAESLLPEKVQDKDGEAQAVPGVQGQEAQGIKAVKAEGF
jgi:hypothetical protein